MKFSIKHIEVSTQRSHVEGANEQIVPVNNTFVADEVEIEVPVEEAVKTAEIAGKEFFMGLITWMKEESMVSHKVADARMLEAENERERLAQRREEKEAEAAANKQ